MSYQETLNTLKHCIERCKGYPNTKYIEHLYNILSKIKFIPDDLSWDFESSELTLFYYVNGQEIEITTDGNNYLIGHLPFKSNPISTEDLNSAVELLSNIFKENNNKNQKE